MNSRTYDAEGHVTQDVCANAGTGTGVSIPACSPNSNFGGTTANLAWGPTGKLRTATNISACDLNGMTIHWDGDRPLFITDSTGALVQLSVETLGGVFYACQSSGYFIVFDRDFSGTQVSAHNSNGDDDPWEYGQLYTHTIGKGAVVESGGWVNGDDLVNGNGVNSVNNLVLAAAREDGYAVRGLMIQGVRSYDSNTEQWTTPDADKGDVDDPMSQRSYMWNDNNPVSYADLTGYSPLNLGMLAEINGADYAGDVAADGGGFAGPEEEDDREERPEEPGTLGEASPQDSVDGTYSWGAEGENGTPREQLDTKYNKHVRDRGEFGDITRGQYTTIGNDIVDLAKHNTCGEVQVKVNGIRAYIYEESTNTLVITQQGKIINIFRPDGGRIGGFDYFINQSGQPVRSLPPY